ncbi:MAG: hypothetical protein ACYC0X_07470 [Pirellulaceae bacterium]
MAWHIRRISDTATARFRLSFANRVGPGLVTLAGIPVIMFCVFASPLGASEMAAMVETGCLRLVINTDGRLVEFVDKQSGLNYVVDGGTACASIRKAGQVFPVTAVSVTDGNATLTFGESGVEAVLHTVARQRHVVWEVVSCQGEGVEEFVFCDIPLELQGAPGEPFAACALARNIKTKVSELPRPASRLRATCYPKFGCAGAAVAIVAGATDELRSALQEAVTAAPELPHSPLGGPFALDAAINRGSYLFNFDGITEEGVGEWIALAKSLGITQIDFHGGSSFRFGDCRPNPARYPQGRANLRAVNDQLHAAGIAAGLHTYAFFIAKDCPWVTPVPDPGLASDVTFTLAESLTATADALNVTESTEKISTITGFFIRNSVTLRIDNELITYSGVQSQPPYGFTGCQRGAYGTQAAAHAPGTKAYHLKECFGMFVPDPETTLFSEVAAATADTFNECGFDMIYFDALDGEDILGGAEWGWHYGSRFVYEVWQRLKKPALMEMSTFHHHLWCVRSRLCAWDHPVRAHKRFIDVHNADNENSRRIFLPGELGWWALKNWTGPQGEPTFADDIEYLMTKGLADDTGFALMGIDPTTAKSVAALPRLAAIIKRYEDLRHSGQVPAALRGQLRQPGAEFTLEGDVSTGWRFLPVEYAKHRVEDSAGPTATWSAANKFTAQPLRMRIEALMAAGPYDAPDNLTLAEFQAAEEFSQHAAQQGVTAELTSSAEQVQIGAVSGKYTALSNSPTPTAAWSMMAQPYAPPRNLDAHRALGVWIHGDGQGEIINFQLHSPEHLVGSLADHYVPIDFTGWRYVELIEPEGSRWSDYQWPYGNMYSIYREYVQHSQITSLGLWYINLPTGKRVTCYMSPIKALPLVPTKLIHPSIRLGDVQLTFPVEIESGYYLEFHALDDCRLYGPQGELVRTVVPTGTVPQLAPGENVLEFRCDAPPGVRARAYITVITQGEPL